MKFFSRAVFAFLSIFVFFTATLTLPAFAQTNQNSLPNYISSETNPDVPQNLHSLTQVVTTEVISTMICQLSGIDVLQRNQSCLGVDPNTHHIGFVNHGGGLIGATMQGIAFTFSIPVHSGDYVAYMASKFGTEKTYAQNIGGVGYQGLQPLLSLWVSFRNIVYLFFVIIFVLVGIAIMLQVQIDPRTIMTIENQLPKIIIGLILVTFSYAIAGFMVDVMWVFTFFVINIVAGTDKTAPTLTNLATINVFQFPLGYLNEVLNTAGHWGIWDLAGGGANAIHTIIVNMFNNNSPVLQNMVGGTNTNQGCGLVDFGCLANAALSNTMAFIMKWILVWLIDIIAFLVIVIAIFITMFRIWFMLLRAYVHIILEVILAPFYIAAGLIPGSSIGFGSWFRSMAANLLAFPVTIFMFVLARVLIDSFFPNGTNPYVTTATTAAGSSLFIPPLIGNPLAGAGAVNPLGAFIALGVIFAIPEILNTLRTALQAPGIGLGAAAMANFGTGGRLLRGTASSATAGFIEPTTGKFAGGFRLGRLLSRI